METDTKVMAQILIEMGAIAKANEINAANSDESVRHYSKRLNEEIENNIRSSSLLSGKIESQKKEIEQYKAEAKTREEVLTNFMREASVLESLTFLIKKVAKSRNAWTNEQRRVADYLIEQLKSWDKTAEGVE